MPGKGAGRLTSSEPRKIRGGMSSSIQIMSWNINGIRAASQKGFADFLRTTKASLLGVQEVRAFEEQVPDEIRNLAGWNMNINSAQRAGYSGVGLFAKHELAPVISKLGSPELDVEGRFQLVHWGKLTIVNSYFPNGKGKERDNSRVPYKLDYYRQLFDFLEKYKAKKGRVLVMGDWNTAHQAIDLARPKQNEKTSGFLPEEREELSRWVEHGWVDTFRHFCTDPGRYTWWSQRAGSRARNVGWRIDYIFASPGAMPFVKHAEIHSEILGSDHCPISVVVDKSILF
jgi:exodeoxyribonuclease III